MSSLGFVARMANWLRGDGDAHVSFDPPEPPASMTVLPVETDRLAHSGEPQPEADETVSGRADRVVPAETQAVLRDMTMRFTRATDALEEIRAGLAGLEQTFEELPESVRAQTRFLNVIADRLEANDLHMRELLTVLRGLPEANTAHARALKRTNDLIEQSQSAIGPIAGGFHRLANTMQGLNESSERHLICLGILADQHERALREQRESFAQHHRVIVTVLSVLGLAAFAGIVLALCALMG